MCAMPETPGLLFEEVWQEISHSIDLTEENQAEQHFLKSLVMGGTVVAERVVNNCQELARYWGNGDKTKALGLTRLFFWMMLSQCYQWIEIGKTDNKNGLVPEKLGRKIMSIFGNMTDGDFKLYIDLYTQYHYDLGNSPHMTHISSLLLALSCEICGHKCLDWTKMSFPVKEMFHLFRKGSVIDTGPIRGVQDITEMKQALTAGIKAMTLYFDRV